MPRLQEFQSYMIYRQGYTLFAHRCYYERGRVV